MVPAPESNRRRVRDISMRIEQLLRFTEGTQVPEPMMVIFMIYGTLGHRFFCGLRRFMTIKIFR
jgi:hypothetical protein